jgi:hypothetical protein
MPESLAEKARRIRAGEKGVTGGTELPQGEQVDTLAGSSTMGTTAGRYKLKLPESRKAEKGYLRGLRGK